MKICEKCGAYNSDERVFCADCDEKLGDKISVQEENALNTEISGVAEKLYNNTDPLYISVFDKILGGISLVGFILLIFLTAAAALKNRDVSISVFGFLCYALCIADAFLPKLLWQLEKLKLSFMISDPENAEPSDFYKICRKFSEVVLCAAGIGITVFMIFSLCRPPVLKYIDELENIDVIINNPAASAVSSQYQAKYDDLWEKVINGGEYTVSVFADELYAAEKTESREQLMIKAIIEIKGLEGEIDYTDKNDFLENYLSFENAAATYSR